MRNKVLIIHNGSFYTNKIIEICQRHGYVVDESGWENFQPSFINHDLLIISGGHQISVEDHESQFSNEIKAIKNANIPVIGICLGFELIAKAFGSNLIYMPKNEKCELSINKLVDDPIFDGINELMVFENHQWKVDKVGDDLVSLAESSDGIEIVKHKNRPIYGFQFHPEKSTAYNCGIKLFENIFTMTRTIL